LKRALEEYVRQNEKFEKTEDFIRRNIAGQKTKQAQSRRRMLEKIERMERPEDIWEAARHLGIEFESGDHPGGKEMIRARGLAIGYDDQPELFRDFDWTLYRGDRVGIVGPNGAGKTSLVHALLGKTKPRAGSVELGFNVQLGYLDQKLDGLEPKRSLLEEVRGVRPDLTIEAARSELGRYRFFGEDAFKAVAALSGGERCRLALLKLSLEPHNLLVLDEPTNHLDIPACEVLERALADYDGSLLVISHDRAFLDAVVNKVLWVEDERVAAYEGNYSEAKRIRSTAEEAPPAAEADAERAGERDREREERRKATREKKRHETQVRALEQEIAALEARSKELNAELVLDPQGDWARLQKLVREEQEIRARLERRYREWERHAQG
jgi:ATP-binding cassette subfamily F protein 3